MPLFSLKGTTANQIQRVPPLPPGPKYDKNTAAKVVRKADMDGKMTKIVSGLEIPALIEFAFFSTVPA